MNTNLLIILANLILAVVFNASIYMYRSRMLKRAGAEPESEPEIIDTEKADRQLFELLKRDDLDLRTQSCELAGAKPEYQAMVAERRRLLHVQQENLKAIAELEYEMGHFIHTHSQEIFGKLLKMKAFT